MGKRFNIIVLTLFFIGVMNSTCFANITFAHRSNTAGDIVLSEMISDTGIKIGTPVGVWKNNFVSLDPSSSSGSQRFFDFTQNLLLDLGLKLNIIYDKKEDDILNDSKVKKAVKTKCGLSGDYALMFLGDQNKDIVGAFVGNASSCPEISKNLRVWEGDSTLNVYFPNAFSTSHIKEEFISPLLILGKSVPEVKQFLNSDVSKLTSKYFSEEGLDQIISLNELSQKQSWEISEIDKLSNAIEKISPYTNKMSKIVRENDKNNSWKGYVSEAVVLTTLSDIQSNLSDIQDNLVLEIEHQKEKAQTRKGIFVLVIFVVIVLILSPFVIKFNKKIERNSKMKHINSLLSRINQIEKDTNDILDDYRKLSITLDFPSHYIDLKTKAIEEKNLEEKVRILKKVLDSLEMFKHNCENAKRLVIKFIKQFEEFYQIISVQYGLEDVFKIDINEIYSNFFSNRTNSWIANGQFEQLASMNKNAVENYQEILTEAKRFNREKIFQEKASQVKRDVLGEALAFFGLEDASDAGKIKTIYRSFVHQYHPDHGKEKDGAKFKIARDYYEILMAENQSI